MKTTEKQIGHTPAPWAIEYDNSDTRGGGCWYVAGPAEVHFPYGAEEVQLQAEADVNLITAAPELLEALSGLVMRMNSETSRFPKSEQLKRATYIRQAEFAIAKAVGGGR